MSNLKLCVCLTMLYWYLRLKILKHLMDHCTLYVLIDTRQVNGSIFMQHLCRMKTIQITRLPHNTDSYFMVRWRWNIKLKYNNYIYHQHNKFWWLFFLIALAMFFNLLANTILVEFKVFIIYITLKNHSQSHIHKCHKIFILLQVLQM
jgi:hypothetical protein